MKKLDNRTLIIALVTGVIAWAFYFLFLKTEKGPKEETESRSATPAPSAPSRTMLSPLLSPDGGLARIVAVGDLHGDLAATRAVLRLAGAIDDKDHWVGGELVLVQTGDEIDRGDDDRFSISSIVSKAKRARRGAASSHCSAITSS